jgi:hypothetical protein
MPLVDPMSAKRDVSNNDDRVVKRPKLAELEQTRAKFVPRYVHYRIRYIPDSNMDSGNARIEKYNELVNLACKLEKYAMGQLPTKGKGGRRVDHKKLLLTDIVAVTIHSGLTLVSTPKERDGYKETQVPELNLICKQYNKNKQSGFCLIIKKWESEKNAKKNFQVWYDGRVSDPKRLAATFLDNKEQFKYLSFPDDYSGGQRELEFEASKGGDVDDDSRSHESEELDEDGDNDDVSIIERKETGESSEITATITDMPLGMDKEPDEDELKDVDVVEMEKQYEIVLEDAAKFNPPVAAMLCYIRKLEKQLSEVQRLVSTTHISNTEEIDKLMTRDGALVRLADDLYQIGCEEHTLAQFERDYGNKIHVLSKQREKVSNRYLEYARKMKAS